MVKLQSYAKPIIFLFISAYCLYAVFFPGFARHWDQWAVSAITCVGVDYLFIRFYKRASFFPFSGLISSGGVFLLTDSPFLWPYVFVSIAAIASKHLLTQNGRHIFNPNNFGVVLAVILFPDWVTVSAGRWGGGSVLMILILALGVMGVIAARRWILSLSFLITFLVFAVVRSLLSGIQLLTVLGPSTGAAFHLYLFYMISDPMTTPQKKKEQVVFGVALGLIDTYFRIRQNKYAPFFALFILTACYAAYRDFQRSKVAEHG